MVKRIHFFVRMFHADDGFLVATTEWLSLHVDLPERRVAVMPTEIASRLAEIYAVHRDLPPPPEVGRVIRAPSPE